MFKSSQASFQHSPSSIIADFAIIPEAVSLTFRQVSVGLALKLDPASVFPTELYQKYHFVPYKMANRKVSISSYGCPEKSCRFWKLHSQGEFSR
jgi:hypothetical protein